MGFFFFGQDQRGSNWLIGSGLWRGKGLKKCLQYEVKERDSDKRKGFVFWGKTMKLGSLEEGER